MKNDWQISPISWLSRESSITDPSVFAVETDAKQAIMCFERTSYDFMAKAMNLEASGDDIKLAGALEAKATSELLLSRCFFGAPAAALNMEALISSGIESVLMVGEAGTITSKCSIGEIIIPSWGIREEGTSYHYIPADTQCGPRGDIFHSVLKELQPHNPKKGGVWTIDAAFRETREKIEKYRKMGVLAVEMECTALMAVAIYRDIDFAAVLIITDDLSGMEWERAFASDLVNTTKEKIANAVARIFGHK